VPRGLRVEHVLIRYPKYHEAVQARIEARNIQVHYRSDRDWHYRTEERRWITLNDNSGWRRIERVGKRIKRGALHVA